MIAIGHFGKAIGEDNRPVNRPDYFERGNQPRVFRQAISAIGAVLGNQKAGFAELLQQLRKQRKGDTAAIGYFLRAHRLSGFALPGSKMLESN